MDYDIFSRCQRNWINEPLPEEHVDLLLKCLESTPTKQSKNYYDIIVSKDQDWNKSIIPLCETFSKDEDTRHWTEEEFYKQTYRNSQVGAPLLILFSRNWISRHEKGFPELSLGFAAGAVKTLANELGYATGYCACFSEKLRKNLKKEIWLGIGIGKPNPKLKYNEVEGPKGNFIIKTKPTEHRITIKG